MNFLYTVYYWIVIFFLDALGSLHLQNYKYRTPSAISLFFSFWFPPCFFSLTLYGLLRRFERFYLFFKTYFLFLLISSFFLIVILCTVFLVLQQVSKSTYRIYNNIERSVNFFFFFLFFRRMTSQPACCSGITLVPLK